MFCDILKALRKQRKIKQSEMASALNVTQGAVANWENGIRAPSIDALPDIAHLLGVSIDQLFGIQPTPKIILTDDEKRVFKNFAEYCRKMRVFPMVFACLFCITRHYSAR